MEILILCYVSVPVFIFILTVAFFMSMARGNILLNIRLEGERILWRDKDSV